MIMQYFTIKSHFYSHRTDAHAHGTHEARACHSILSIVVYSLALLDFCLPKPFCATNYRFSNSRIESACQSGYPFTEPIRINWSIFSCIDCMSRKASSSILCRASIDELASSSFAGSCATFCSAARASPRGRSHASSTSEGRRLQLGLRSTVVSLR